MEDLYERNIKLIDYMDSIGGLNSKFDKRAKVEGNIFYIFIDYKIYMIQVIYIICMFIDDESNDESEVEFDLEEDGDDPTGVEENTINNEQHKSRYLVLIL